MIKNLINFAILAPIFAITPFLTNLQNIKVVNKNFETNNNSFNYVNESITIDNSEEGKQSFGVKPTSSMEDLEFRGSNYNTEYRVFLDSTGDKSLPPSSFNTKDWMIGNGNKDQWYPHLVEGLSIDVTNYADNKTDFLKKYKSVTLSYIYKFNFWNSQKGWYHEYGKNSPLIPEVKTFKVTGTDYQTLILEDSANSHKNKEKANLIIRQEWNGNILKYNFHLGVYYTWNWGSSVDHASVASFANDSYSFTAVPEEVSGRVINIEELSSESSFAIPSVSTSSQIYLTEFDSAIRVKGQKSYINNSIFRTVTQTIQTYQGKKKVGNTMFFRTLTIKWPGWFSQDSNTILHGEKSPRTLKAKTDSSGSQLSFTYQNSFADEQSEYYKLQTEILNMPMTGHFYSNVIYV